MARLALTGVSAACMFASVTHATPVQTVVIAKSETEPMNVSGIYIARVEGRSWMTSGTVAKPSGFVPKTPLAKRLYEIRQKAIAEGLVLRPSAEIIAEVRASRE